MTPDALLPCQLRRLLNGYCGILAKPHEGLGFDSQIVLRPLEGFLLPRPWQKDHAILIGDAAHPATPQLASGARLAVEDALVLGEETARHATLEQAFASFMDRRYERCRLVVENFLEIGCLEQVRAPAEAQTDIVERSLRSSPSPSDQDPVQVNAMQPSARQQLPTSPQNAWRR